MCFRLLCEAMISNVAADAREWARVEDEEKLARLRERLATLDEERAALAAEIASLQVGVEAPSPPAPLADNGRLARLSPSVNTHSPAAAKIAVFKRLFRGRSDVFPLRWENAKTGRSGYSPACANE